MADDQQKVRHVNAAAAALLMTPLLLLAGLIGLLTLERLPYAHEVLKAAGISKLLEWIATRLGING